MALNQFCGHRSGRALLRGTAWLVLVLMILPPLHLILPEGRGHSPSAADTRRGETGSGSFLSRNDRLHSPLDCPLCQELLNVAATPGPAAPEAATLPTAPTEIEATAGRPGATPVSSPGAPRAPPSLLG